MFANDDETIKLIDETKRLKKLILQNESLLY